MKFVISLFLVSNYTFKGDCPHCRDKYLTLPWLIGTRHFPESKTRPRIQKHDPKYFREFKTLFKNSWECFRILGSAFGFREVCFDWAHDIILKVKLESVLSLRGTAV